MRKTISALALAAAVAGCNSGISDEQRQQLLSELEANLAGARKMEQQRAAGTRVFFAGDEAQNQPCGPFILLGHPHATPSSTGNSRVVARADTGWNVTATDVASLEALKGKRIQAIEKDAARLRAQISGKGLPPGWEAIDNEKGLQYGKRRVAELGNPSWYRHEIIYAPVKIVTELPYKDGKYPSFVRGRAMVWDYQAGKVVCSAQEEANFYGTVKAYYRRDTGVTDADMMRAVKDGLLEAVYARTLLRLGVGVPEK
jgi:hypothetical protein